MGMTLLAPRGRSIPYCAADPAQGDYPGLIWTTLDRVGETPSAAALSGRRHRTHSTSQLTVFRASTSAVGYDAPLLHGVDQNRIALWTPPRVITLGLSGQPLTGLAKHRLPLLSVVGDPGPFHLTIDDPLASTMPLGMTLHCSARSTTTVALLAPRWMTWCEKNGSLGKMYLPGDTLLTP